MGYLAWSWTGNSEDVGYLDLSVDGSATNLTPWGDDNIINGQNGLPKDQPTCQHLRGALTGRPTNVSGASSSRCR